MSLLHEVSANVLAADVLSANTLVLEAPTPPTMATVSQQLITNTVITLPADDVIRINVVFTNAIPIAQTVNISISNTQNVQLKVGTELVLYFQLIANGGDRSEIILSSDFFLLNRTEPTNTIQVSDIQYLVARFSFNGAVFANTDENC